eukprot:TRINITY_DN1568_c0_g5_i1.p1 TRINITY_DN1568_c0_g5~~TRINITY_DN1568_c0_g5_i1.p1  ORF type:complete len:205 (-),score=21.95 TRINITY_DN1568_c0_g5_i1:530-1144(-)
MMMTRVGKDSARASCASSRMEKFLGLPQSPSVVSSGEDLQEEDVWAHWPCPDAHVHATPVGRTTSPVRGESAQTHGGSAESAARRWFQGAAAAAAAAAGGGLSVAFENSSLPLSLRAIPHVRGAQSLPVRVPLWSTLLSEHAGDGKGEGAEEEELLPPHVVVAKEESLRGDLRFSVLQGAGRTLKGRDMSRVRNAVWSRTGFLG